MLQQFQLKEIVFFEGGHGEGWGKWGMGSAECGMRKVDTCP
jgi:hypothetical protein